MKTKTILSLLVVLSISLSIGVVNAGCIVGSVDTPGNAMDVVVVGNIAYVAENGAWPTSLQTIDVSDPKNPVILDEDIIPESWVSLLDGPARIYVQGNRLYFTSFWAGLTIFDISNPSNPAQIKAYQPVGCAGSPASVSVKGNYAYIGMSGVGAGLTNGCFCVVDVSNPLSPSVEYALPCSWPATPLPGSVLDVYVSGDYAYLAEYSPGATVGLQIFDISDPSAPDLEGSYGLPGGLMAWSVHKSGDYAYLASNAGLRIIDVSIPLAPFEESAYGANSAGVYVSGDYAYIKSGSVFQVLDVSDKSDPVLVEECDLPSMGLDVFIQGNYAYVATGDTGLQIINIGEPKAEVEVEVDGRTYTGGLTVPETMGQVTIRSTAWDDSSITSHIIHWTIDNWVTETVADCGSSTTCSQPFGASVIQSFVGKTIKYYVEVEDDSGNTITSPDWGSANPEDDTWCINIAPECSFPLTDTCYSQTENTNFESMHTYILPADPTKEYHITEVGYIIDTDAGGTAHGRVEYRIGEGSDTFISGSAAGTSGGGFSHSTTVDISAYNQKLEIKFKIKQDIADKNAYIQGEKIDGSCGTMTSDKCYGFVTSQTYQGTLGGLNGADLNCQTLADNSGYWMGGTWKAWLSDKTTDAAERIPHSSAGYYRPDGTRIAYSWNNLITGGVDNPIDLTEDGSPKGGGPVRTNTKIDGTKDKDTDLGTCYDYSSTLDSTSGGDSLGILSLWTEGSSPGCGDWASLYCFSCDTAPVVTSNKCYAFVTSQNYNGNLVGLSGADAKCQTLADNSGYWSAGHWNAWLSDSTTDARDRIQHSSGGYYLLDETKIANNWADLTDGSIFWIRIDENGALKFPLTFVWTGTDFDGTATANTCLDWIQNLIGTGDAGRMLFFFPPETWTTGFSMGCGNPLALYCFSCDSGPIECDANQATCDKGVCKDSLCDGGSCWTEEAESNVFGEYGDAAGSIFDLGPASVTAGNLVECCGDDTGEKYVNLGPSAPKCCEETRNYVDASGNCVYECDAEKAACDTLTCRDSLCAGGPPGDSCWNIGGDTAATECCGDDLEENYILSLDGTYACCDNKDNLNVDLGGTECVIGGECKDRLPTAEICNGIDDNCDGNIAANEIDDDGDGVSECNGDCDDADPARYPGNPEDCDGKDNDCNYLVDAADPGLITGPPCTSQLGVCFGKNKYCDGVWKDCDALGYQTYEICNDGVDNDCDGDTDGDDDGCKPCAIGYPCKACTTGWVTKDPGHAGCPGPIYDGCVRNSGAGYLDWACCNNMICKIQKQIHI